MSGPLITKPGAYPDIAAEDYHGREICWQPSISSTGLKTLLECPVKYWHDSPLNPHREPRAEKPHFALGKAAHDMLLLKDRWPDAYHVTPEGFSRAKSKVFAAEIESADAAAADGKTILTAAQAISARQIAAALRANPIASAALTNGTPELTLAWQDAETGVVLRARPDFLPTKRRYIPDIKTAASGAPADFARAVESFGYHQSAALYLDGIEAVFGERPESFFFVVIEKEAPFVVSLYELDPDDIDQGRDLNRRAIRRFADCLSRDHWPGYVEDVTRVSRPAWARKAHEAMLEKEIDQ